MERKIFVTSDTHFGHDRDFIYKPRGFKNVAESNEKIILNWNSVVGKNDIVYHLGDVLLGDSEVNKKYLNRLNGEIHFIFGNHDSDKRKEIYKAYGIIEGYAAVISHKGYTYYLSHYPTITCNYDIDKPLSRRTINLCGHTHTRDKFADMNKGLIFHCELDAHNNTPILIDKIPNLIRKYEESHNPK